jgi:hypothetical protein
MLSTTSFKGTYRSSVDIWPPTVEMGAETPADLHITTSVTSSVRNKDCNMTTNCRKTHKLQIERNKFERLISCLNQTTQQKDIQK